MTEPVQFPSTTPRHSFPLLFAGQAQKEFFVNAGFALCDALLHPAVEGETAAPPAAPADGDSWLVADGATGEFAGQEGHIASRQAGAWLFAPPRDGMRVLDKQAGQQLLFFGEWRRAATVADPGGGTTIDSEARAAISALIATLKAYAFLPEN